MCQKIDPTPQIKGEYFIGSHMCPWMAWEHELQFL